MRRGIPRNRTRGWVAAVLAVLTGLGCLALVAGFSRLSYDYLFLFRPATPVVNVVIIYMDEASLRELDQASDARWDRALHARLLERLTRDGARLVVFDVLFAT